MKQGHYALAFFLIFCCLSIQVYIEQEEYFVVVREKEKMEESLLVAAEMAAGYMTGVMQEDIETKLYMLKEVFLETWFIHLGIAGNQEEKERLQLHLPLVGWLEEEGAYFLTVKQVEEDYKLEWSSCIPYV